jgi:hypothetical protein
MIKPLKDCEYSAFISYAHADDEAWFGWVSQFKRELERGLAAVLRGAKLPPVHLSAFNGPVSGELAQQLSERVARAFAMIIVVHDNYVQSEWCLKELEYFKASFGDAGLRERLYILALSEPAVQQASAGAAWQRLLPTGDQVWLPFYDEADRTQAAPVYMGPELVSPRFREQFLRLRRDFAEKIKASIGEDRTPIVTPVATPAGTGPTPTPAVGAGVGAAAALPRDVRLYIESNRHELDLWQSLGEQMRRRWDKLTAAVPGEQQATLQLRARGLPVEQIDAYPSLDDADGVVLLWGRKSADALVAQINKVENKLSPGRDAAPGVVAYLMPPQEAGESIPAWGWQVLRFRAEPREHIDVVDEEADVLEGFLRRVLERRLQRAAAVAAGG